MMVKYHIQQVNKKSTLGRGEESSYAAFDKWLSRKFFTLISKVRFLHAVRDCLLV